MRYIDKFLQEIKSNNQIITSKIIGDFLSSIVVMTFTKKAVGELEIRIKKKIKQRSQHEKNWGLVLAEVERLNITTIHGLCRQLLHSHLLNSQSMGELQIISSLEFERKIQRLLIQWFEQAPFDERFKQQVIIYEPQILAAFINIFSNADLRWWWESELSCPSPVDAQGQMVHLLHLLNVEQLQRPWDFGPLEHSSKKLSWMMIVEKFNQLLLQVPLASIHGLLAVEKFFGEIPRLMAPKNFPIAQEYLQQLKQLREFVRKHQESLQAFLNESELHGQWQKFYQDIFSFINSHYLDYPGISFADLEYYLLKVMDDVAQQEKIQQAFRYIIVDEFQDTSNVQYGIIKKIARRDLSNLFVVGDLKQAIYGFRGGELAVFLDGLKSLPLHQELVNNYRSCQKVVEFNNNFFATLFPLGPGFVGNDPVAVAMSNQKPMALGGAVTRLVCKIQVAEKLSALEYDSTESFLLLRKIKDIRQMDSQLQICVLYRKISPSLKLITLLVQEQIPFNAKVKLPLKDDPLWNIFMWVHQFLIDQPDQGPVYGQLIALTLEHLQFGPAISASHVTHQLERFRLDYQYFGLESALILLFLSLEISNSNYQATWDLMVLVMRICQEDPMQILQVIREQEDNSYLLDLQYLDQAGQLTIMTAHGAKGLEFDVVFLGGIYTNGQSKQEKKFLGNLPGSFCWKKHVGSTITYQSPQMIYEEVLNKCKNFSEMKRLLYVAATRAKSQLIWVDLNTEYGGDQFIGKDSWAHALKRYGVAGENTAVQEEILPDLAQPLVVEIRSALYQRDNLGIIPTPGRPISVILPELSVTRLTDVIDCPRKFYLRHLLKLELNDDVGEDADNADNNDHMIKGEKFSGIGGGSSAQRGNFLHQKLEKIIRNNLLIDTDDPALEQLRPVRDYLQNYQEDYLFFPEYAVKFSLEGMMITGSLDLLLRPKELGKSQWKILDFKSGACSEQDLNKYWYQLYLYGWGIGQRNGLQSLGLEIVAIDQQQVFSRSVTMEEIAVAINQLLALAQTPEQTSCTHCPLCPYQQLCGSTELC